MITIFTIPKPFIGHIDIIQTNAINNWLHVFPQVEIIIWGDEASSENIAKKFNLKFCKIERKNEYGTPFLDSIFLETQKIAKFRMVCYTNADILFPYKIREIVSGFEKGNYLIAGQRWNIPCENFMDFNHPGWETELLEKAKMAGDIEPPCGIDYFIFPKNVITSFLPLVVGRKGWDNWFIYYSQKMGLKVVNISACLMVFHQDHDYCHINGKTGKKWEGPESDNNMKTIGNIRYCWSLDDSNYVLDTNCGLQKHKLSVYRMLILTTPKIIHYLIDISMRPIHQLIRKLRYEQ